MPVGTCDPASRGDAYNTVMIIDGPVSIEVRFGWDRVSTKATGCDGPVSYIRVYNTGTVTWYAHLPNKKKGDPWVEIPAGTDVTIGSGQRTQLGLENYSDVAGVGLGSDPLAASIAASPAV